MPNNDLPQRGVEPFRVYRRRTNEWVRVFTVQIPEMLWPKLRTASKKKTPSEHISGLVQEALLKKGKR